MLVSQRWAVALGICGVFVASQGCSGSDDGGNVVTEDQLASDPNLVVDPGDGVVAVFLEPPTSGGSQTGSRKGAHSWTTLRKPQSLEPG